MGKDTMTAKEFRELKYEKFVNTKHYSHKDLYESVESKYTEFQMLDFANWWANKNDQCGISDLRKFEKLSSSKMQGNHK